jgi:hypothetical protein
VYYDGISGIRVKPRAERLAPRSFGHPDGAFLEARTPQTGHTLPIEAERLELKGGLDSRSGMATALVLFGLFFVCVYLLPSLTCEERERGVCCWRKPCRRPRPPRS